MFAHDDPLFIRQFARLEQDPVGDAKFTHIVQQCAAADMHDLFFVNPHFHGEVQRHLGHPLRMPLRFLITQVHCP